MQVEEVAVARPDMPAGRVTASARQQRQAGADEALGVGHRLPVEPPDLGRERIDERVAVGIQQGAVHVTTGSSVVGAGVV